MLQIPLVKFSSWHCVDRIIVKSSFGMHEGFVFSSFDVFLHPQTVLGFLFMRQTNVVK